MITDLKFNEAMFTGRKISDLSDTPSSDGMSAADLKAYFDYIPKTMIALGALNSLIDALVSSGGAGNIGASVSGVTGTQVQPILESMKVMLDDRYTKEAVDSLFSAKADNATVNAMVKSIEFDQSTGVFTITRQDGTTYTLDTLLEKLAVNFVYDSATQSLLITLSDGTTQTVPLSDFITDTEIKSTDTINVTETGGVITLNIKSGSITDDMLSSALLSAMQGYVQNCATSASNAGASANNAKTYSDSAAESASSALVSKNSAVESASSALASKNSASTSETNAAESAAKAQAAQAAAEKARDEAQAIAGGDYATRTELNEHANNATLHFTADEKTKLSGIEANANNYVHPSSHPANMITEDSTHRFVTDSEKNVWSSKSDFSGEYKDLINKPTVSATTLLALSWDSTAKTYSFEADYPTSTHDIEIALDSTATSEQAEAFNGAQIVGSATSNIIKAYGIVPTVDIPVIIKVVTK